MVDRLGHEKIKLLDSVFLAKYRLYQRNMQITKFCQNRHLMHHFIEKSLRASHAEVYHSSVFKTLKYLYAMSKHVHV